MNLRKHTAAGCSFGLLIMGLLNQPSAGAFEFSAAGTIEKDVDNVLPNAWKKLLAKGVIPPNEAMPATNSVHRFQVDVRDCRWRIRLISDTPGTTNDLPSFDAGSDGVDTYIVVRAGSVSAFTNLTVTNAVGEMFAGPVLFEKLPAAIVWLSFCSGCYFDSVRTNQIIPVHAAMAPGIVQPRSFLRRAEWESLSPRPHVPGLVRYYENEVNYLMAAYTVDATTNQAGCILPLEFRFQTFAPDYSKNPDNPEIRLSIRWRGRLTHFTPAVSLADNEFIPALPGRVPVADRRFAGAGVPLVGYITREWQPAERVAASPQYKVWEAAAPTMPTTAKPSRNNRLYAVCFILLSIGSLTWIFFFRTRDTVGRTKS